jgi:hypothetical protein
MTPLVVCHWEPTVNMWIQEELQAYSGDYSGLPYGAPSVDQPYGDYRPVPRTPCYVQPTEVRTIVQTPAPPAPTLTPTSAPTVEVIAAPTEMPTEVIVVTEMPTETPWPTITPTVEPTPNDNVPVQFPHT